MQGGREAGRQGEREGRREAGRQAGREPEGGRRAGREGEKGEGSRQEGREGMLKFPATGAAAEHLTDPLKPHADVKPRFESTIISPFTSLSLPLFIPRSFFPGASVPAVSPSLHSSLFLPPTLPSLTSQCPSTFLANALPFTYIIIPPIPSSPSFPNLSLLQSLPLPPSSTAAPTTDSPFL